MDISLGTNILIVGYEWLLLFFGMLHFMELPKMSDVLPFQGCSKTCMVTYDTAMDIPACL